MSETNQELQNSEAPAGGLPDGWMADAEADSPMVMKPFEWVAGERDAEPDPEFPTLPVQTHRVDVAFGSYDINEMQSGVFQWGYHFCDYYDEEGGFKGEDLEACKLACWRDYRERLSFMFRPA